MPRFTLLLAAVLALALFSASAHAAPPVSEVYRDDFVTVRAGILEIGSQPIHLGDAVSLTIEVEFDAAQVRVETLDSDFFQRTFANHKSIKLYGPPAVTRQSRSRDLVEIRAVWQFQILDCPEDLANCAGDKIYELPVIAIAYQLVNEAGETLNNKSARFKPWPGRIAVARTISDSAGEFSDYFPGGAYPEALPINDRHYAGLLAAIGGGFIFALGVGGRLLGRESRPHAMQTRLPANRWESALAELHGGSLADDQWADMLRRCATWFCLDELDCNPYAWLADSGQSISGKPNLTEFHGFFVDVLGQESIGKEHRNEYVSRFTRLAEKTVGFRPLEGVI